MPAKNKNEPPACCLLLSFYFWCHERILLYCGSSCCTTSLLPFYLTQDGGHTLNVVLFLYMSYRSFFWLTIVFLYNTTQIAAYLRAAQVGCYFVFLLLPAMAGELLFFLPVALGTWQFLSFYLTEITHILTLHITS